MSATARVDVFAFFSETLALPAGVTATINPIAGQISAILKYVSGGSLVVLSNPGSSYAPFGTTLIGSTFGISSLYIVGANEIVNVMLSGPLVLQATGSTCIAQLLRGRSQNT